MEELLGANLLDLYEQLPVDDKKIEVGGSGGVTVQSIGNGLFRCVLPDGRVVIVDPSGKIVG